MEWVAIVQMIIKMIAECREDRSSEEIMRGLGRPGLVERLALRSVLRDDCGLEGRDLWKTTREGMQKLKQAKPTQLSALMAAAEVMTGAKPDEATIQEILRG